MEIELLTKKIIYREKIESPELKNASILKMRIKFYFSRENFREILVHQ